MAKLVLVANARTYQAPQQQPEDYYRESVYQETDNETRHAHCSIQYHGIAERTISIVSTGRPLVIKKGYVTRRAVWVRDNK
jgi:hypothetical protein